MNTTDNYTPFVSVIVPIYNGETDIPDLIACLINQTYDSNQCEFLLVDNNSQDNTANLIKESIEKYQETGKKLKYLSENQIQSSYAARNTGIKEAQGEIIAFTDADCRPKPDWLINLIQPFANPKVSIVAGEIEGLEGDSLLEKYATFYGTLSQKYTLEHPFSAYGQTANLAIKKEVFPIIGLFRPYLTTGGDADICWRILREVESEIIFVPSAVVLHRHRDNLKDFKSQWQRYGKSGKYLHEMYGVDLIPEFNYQTTAKRILQWLIKDFPLTTIKAILGKREFIECWKTPIDLIRWHSRSQGQKNAKLPEEAKKIDRLTKL